MTVIIVPVPSIVIFVRPPVRRTTASWSSAVLGVAIASVVSPTIIVVSSFGHCHPQLGGGSHSPGVQALFHSDGESILYLQLRKKVLNALNTTNVKDVGCSSYFIDVLLHLLQSSFGVRWIDITYECESPGLLRDRIWRTGHWKLNRGVNNLYSAILAR